MASRHRVRAPCMQIIKTATVPAALTKRVNIKQFHDSKIKFPLTRRMARCAAVHMLGPPSRLQFRDMLTYLEKPSASRRVNRHGGFGWAGWLVPL